jgi:Concanavalin A-like lectin/glucanases superfamily/Secretion system C-terminal sorting domain
VFLFGFITVLHLQNITVKATSFHLKTQFMKLKQLHILSVILLFNSSIIFAQPTTTGMLAYFTLNGTSANTGPATVSATMANTTFTTNKANTPNSAVQFAGNLNSLINFTDNGNLDFTGNTNFTISFAFFFNGSTTSGLVDNCLNYGGWGIWLWSTVAGTWNLQFNYKNNSVGSAAATAFTIGQWHHVTAVRNNGTISLYIDGVFRLSAAEGTATPTYPINMIAGAMAYGSFSPPRYNPFGGKMDELRAYNRALSAGEIAILSAAATLPLKLGDFTATKKTTGTQLNWETLTEQNTARFEIERSTDGTTFTTIGAVNAAGNSSTSQYYTYTDPANLTGTILYRLKMIDKDDTYAYSRIVAVKSSESQIKISIFPNPVSDLLQVQLPATQKEETVIYVYDASRRIVIQKTIKLTEGNNALSIPVAQLPKGIYTLSVNNNTLQTKQFIKQ